MGLVSCHPAAISSCCYFLQTGTANPTCDSSMRWIGTWFWQLQAWQTLAWAGPTGAALPKRWLGEKRKRQKGKGAEVLVLYGLYAEALSRTWGVQPKELCQVRRALHSPFPSSTFSWWSLRNTWSHLPPWAATLLKVIYWKSTYLGQESSLSSMAMVVGGSEWVSRDREYLRIRDTQTPVWSRRSLLCYQHILPKERQEIIWETEDHI